MTKTHKDVEYAVDTHDRRGSIEKIFKTFDEAAGHAVSLAMSHGEAVNLDVLCYSEEGAKSVLGETGVEMYNEDPEASVFCRITIKADDQGRVP